MPVALRFEATPVKEQPTTTCLLPSCTDVPSREGHTPEVPKAGKQVCGAISQHEGASTKAWGVGLPANNASRCNHVLERSGCLSRWVSSSDLVTKLARSRWAWLQLDRRYIWHGTIESILDAGISLEPSAGEPLPSTLAVRNLGPSLITDSPVQAETNRPAPCFFPQHIAMVLEA